MNVVTIAWFAMVIVGGLLTLAAGFVLARSARLPRWAKAIAIPAVLVAGGLGTLFFATWIVRINIPFGDP